MSGPLAAILSSPLGPRHRKLAQRAYELLRADLGREAVVLWEDRYQGDGPRPEMSGIRLLVVLLGPGWLADPSPVAVRFRHYLRLLLTSNTHGVIGLTDDVPSPEPGALPEGFRVIAGFRTIRLGADLEMNARHVVEAVLQQLPADEQGRRCGNCGQWISRSKRFCPVCGAYVDLGDTGGQRERREAPPVPASALPRPPAPAGAPRPRSAPPLPSTPAARTLDDVIRDAVAEVVAPGMLAFNPPERMRQGEGQRVEVRVARGTDLQEALEAELRGRGTPVTERIDTSPFMAVTLLGEAFDVVSLSPTEQLVAQIARWEFDVRPRRAGAQRLLLAVALRIALPGRADERIAVPVFERTIAVTVNPVYNARRFLQDNWQWVTATALGLGGAIAAWLNIAR